MRLYVASTIGRSLDITDLKGDSFHMKQTLKAKEIGDEINLPYIMRKITFFF